jgi:RNA polymerase sigma-70 factor (ECF subfamily)
MRWRSLSVGNPVRTSGISQPSLNTDQVECRGFFLAKDKREQQTHFSESDLIHRVLLRNDNKAFGELVSIHQSHVRGFLRRLCKTDSIADDLAQDTFVIAFRQLAKFRGSGSFEGWLLRIAYRCFLQNYRQQKQQSKFYEFLTQQLSNDTDIFMNKPEEKLDLERGLAKLEPIQAAAITLNFSMGYSHAETSLILDIPVGTAKSHIGRGMERLRKLMSDSDQENTSCH